MRLLRFALPAVALAAWLAVSFAQQQPAPAQQTPPPPAASPPAPTPEDEEQDAPAEEPGEEVEEECIPTEELQPDAAVTFPVDI